MKNMIRGPLTNRSRHEVWHDVTRRKAPALSAKGRAAKRRRWVSDYERLAESWTPRDLDTAIYWQQRATECAQNEEREYGYNEEKESGST